MNRLLLVEDHRTLCDSLSRYLQEEGYRIQVTYSLGEARALPLENFDAMILDWMLPDGQGIDFLREVRSRNLKIPILLITAKVDLVDKVVGLEMGANDYLTKPFEPRELLARLRAQLRALQSVAASLPSGFEPSAGTAAEGRLPLEPNYRHGDLFLNPNTRKVFQGGKEVPMTRMEYELLKFFLANPGRVFSREALLNRVWGYENYQTTRTVDNHIAFLRQKLGTKHFETARGAGYRLTSQLDSGEPR